MLDSINHNEQYDALGELFRRQLENYRLTVDGNDWNEIEQRLSRKKKFKAIWFWSTGVMAAAATIALLVVVTWPSVNDTAETVASWQVLTDNGTIENKEFSADEDIRLKKDNLQVTDSRDTQSDADVHISSVLSGTNTKKTQYSPEGIPKKEMTYSKDISEEILSDSSQTTDQVVQIVSDDGWNAQDSINDSHADIDKPVKLDVSLVADDPEDEPVQKKNGKWIVAAAFGWSGSTSDFGDEVPYPDQYADFMPGNKYATELSGNIRSFDGMSTKDFSDIDCGIPLSFGFTLRKKWEKHWGVESGLVYTYLPTNLSWSSYHVQQRLHYLGIPVNLVVYLWDSKPNWKIYLSGGMMLEKGLRVSYTQENRQSDQIRTTVVKTSVDGFQWSFNGALGVNYRFDKGFGFYLEPRLSYYFDNEQPVSIRTEWPLTIGINMGLNYEF